MAQLQPAVPLGHLLRRRPDGRHSRLPRHDAQRSPAEAAGHGAARVDHRVLRPQDVRSGGHADLQGVRCHTRGVQGSRRGPAAAHLDRDAARPAAAHPGHAGRDAGGLREGRRGDLSPRHPPPRGPGLHRHRHRADGTRRPQAVRRAGDPLHRADLHRELPDAGCGRPDRALPRRHRPQRDEPRDRAHHRRPRRAVHVRRRARYLPGARRVRAALVALLSCGCALPVVSAGTFLPAGDLESGDLHASISLESGRVLAGPSDVHDLPATPPEAEQYEVSTWVASDVSVRWQAASRLTLEAQLKLTNPVVPFTPMVVGAAIGARVRVHGRPPEGGLSVEVGARVVGVGAEQRIERSASGRTQTDVWAYRSIGIEVPVIATYRVNPLFAVTAAPFLRAYWIRAWHDKIVGLTTSQAVLQWSPVLSAGFGTAAAFDLGPVQLSPGVAIELATKPGPNAATRFLFEPGVCVGTRF